MACNGADYDGNGTLDLALTNNEPERRRVTRVTSVDSRELTVKVR
jgi:hypothetical protein